MRGSVRLSSDSGLDERKARIVLSAVGSPNESISGVFAVDLQSVRLVQFPGESNANSPAFVWSPLSPFRLGA